MVGMFLLAEKCGETGFVHIHAQVPYGRAVVFPSRLTCHVSLYDNLKSFISFIARKNCCEDFKAI